MAKTKSTNYYNGQLLTNEKENEQARLYQHYKLLALNRYRWNNLPEGIESRHIEEFLFNHGQAFFTYDKSLGYICLACSNAGALNVYGDPLNVNMIGVGFSQIKKISEGVRILNNDVAIPDTINVYELTKKMAEAEKVAHDNVRQQKFPFIVSTTKETQFSMRNLFTQFFDKSEPVIYMDKNFTEDGKVGINVMRTDAPYVADKVGEYKDKLEKELLTMLGINNLEQKTERMIVDEANVNNSEIEMNLDLGFKSRENAAKIINETYGLNIEVEKVAREIETTFDTTLRKKEEGGESYE